MVKVQFDLAPLSAKFVSASIYYRKKGLLKLTLAGETRNTDYVIHKLEPGCEYTVMVLGVSASGEPASFDSGITGSVITSQEYDILASQISTVRISGLHLLGKPNEIFFSGQDCSIEWNKLSITRNDENSINAGVTDLSDGWLSHYVVQVYSGAILLRERSVTIPMFLYSYADNVKDNSPSIAAALTFTVFAVDKFGRTTKSSSLTLSNSVPASVAGLVSSQLIEGVQFAWTKSLDEDLRGYSYRTKVAGGSWGSWTDTENNVVNRILSAAEIALYTNKPTIYIEVKAKDWFGQTSVAATAANAKAGQIADNIFNLSGTLDDGITGSVEDLFDGSSTGNYVEIT
jgi:hypothetical protein